MKPLGITATVDAINQDSWFTAIAAGDFQASLHWTDSGATPWDVYADIMDGAQLQPIGGNALWNFGRYDNPDVTQALATYAATSDDAEREAALATIQKTFVEDVPAISLLGRPSAAQYSTKNFVGWPSEDDPYASPQPTNIGASLILTKLKPAS